MTHDGLENVTSSDWGDVTANAIDPGVALVISLVAAAALLVALAVYVYGDAARFRRVARLLDALKRAVHLFALGLGALVPLAGVGGLVFLFTRLESGSQARVGLWLAVGVAVFAAVAGLGWITEKWLARVRAHRAAMEAEKEASA